MQGVCCLPGPWPPPPPHRRLHQEGAWLSAGGNLCANISWLSVAGRGGRPGNSTWELQRNSGEQERSGQPCVSKHPVHACWLHTAVVLIQPTLTQV
jgi:hypothetical protein